MASNVIKKVIFGHPKWPPAAILWTKFEKQGNSVARDLPRTGSETNTLHVIPYIMTCISTIWGNHLPHLTSKWRGTFQYFQSHDKIPYIYYLEKPPPTSSCKWRGTFQYFQHTKKNMKKTLNEK